MVKFKQFNKYELIYLTFAFDSLLKIPLGGFKLHIGILLILLILPLSIITSKEIKGIKNFVFKNWTIFLFMSYLVVNIAINHSYPGIMITLTYYSLGILMFYFIFIKEKYISTDAVIVFQWILIITGLFQFLLFKFTGYQISFIDPEHYMTDASFATRLRGFFVEPNWYSIIISFNILLLVMQLKRNIFRYKILILFTLLVLLFNASYTFLGVVVLGIFIRFFIDLPHVSKRRFSLLFFIFIILSMTFVARNYFKSEQNNQGIEINYGSRMFPMINTTLFMSEQNIYVQLFGYGIGSWPYVGLEQNGLGYIGYFGEYKIEPAQRDSSEYQVFLLELGYVGLFLFILDYIYNYWKYRKLNFIYSLATAFMLASFLAYPIFKFAMYLIPYYIIRAKALKEFYQLGSK